MRLPILVFHKIGAIPPKALHPRNYVLPEQFDALLASLRRSGYESITFAQYLAHRRGEGALPRRPIILSFDDGYRCNAEIAAPIMRRWGFRATIFVLPAKLGGTNDWDAEEVQDPLLTADEVRAMRADGFEFGSHTMHHVKLTAVSPEVARQELRDSKAALEALLGEPVTTICYPWAQHNAEVRRIAAEVGYACGVGIHRRLNRESTDVMGLNRIPVRYIDSTMRIRWDMWRLRFKST